MRAAVYLRQSQDRALDELGIDRQRDACAALARARGWELAGEYVDNDTSASNGKPRAHFQRLLGDVRAGHVDVIVARDVDRLCRRLADLETVLDHCREAGARVVTAAEGVDTGTDAGRLVARILGSVAQGETERKSRRQADAAVQAAQQGRRTGGRRPFGYEVDGLTVRPAEAAAIRRAYTDLLSGVSLGAIAREWNAAGLRSGQTRWAPDRKGQPSQWSRDTVRRVLLNPRNAGLRAHRKVIVGPAEWPALVDEGTWRAADELLRDPARFSGGAGRRGRQLLTGIAMCGVCDATVHGGAATHGKPTYRCSGSFGHISRQAEPVDDYVSDVVIERLSRPDAVDLLADTDRPDVDELRAQAIALRSRLESAAVEFADDDAVSPQQFRAITQRLRARLSAVETEMADAGRVDVLGELVAADDVAAMWADELHTARKRAVIDALMTVRLLPVGRGTRIFRESSVEITPKQRL